jgi:hypothetical protein
VAGGGGDAEWGGWTGSRMVASTAREAAGTGGFEVAGGGAVPGGAVETACGFAAGMRTVTSTALGTTAGGTTGAGEGAEATGSGVGGFSSGAHSGTGV